MEADDKKAQAEAVKRENAIREDCAQIAASCATGWRAADMIRETIKGKPND